jgi:hypothetical protein
MTASKGKSQKNKSDFRWFVGSIFNVIRRFGHQLIWAGLLGYLGHLTANVVIAFAGKPSNANLGVRIAANLNVAVTVSLAVTGLSIGLYLRERKLHRETRERLTARLTTLELRVNPTRTSSRLTPEGLTRKEDL